MSALLSLVLQSVVDQRRDVTLRVLVLDLSVDGLQPVDGVLHVDLVCVVVAQQEVPEIIWQLQAHQVVLEHEQVQREVLDAVVNVPSLSNAVLNLVLALDEQLIAFNRAPRHEKNVRVLDVLRVLQHELVYNHLDRLQLGPDDVDLGARFTAEVRALQLDLASQDAVLFDASGELV